MDVYLLRHGDSVAENIDARRPLTQRGRDAVESVGRRAVEKGLNVFQIMHSGKLRARETAEILQRHAAPAGGSREISGLDPQADPFIAQAEIAAAAKSVALVGHMPHLGRLVSLLLTGDPDRDPYDFPPAGLLRLTNDGGWKIVEAIDPR